MSRKGVATITAVLGAALLASFASRAGTSASLAAASRRYTPTKWILGPIYATGCPLDARCGTGSDMAGEVNSDLDHLSVHDIPITVYHFDGAGWSSGSCKWALGDRLVERLRSRNLRAMLHVWGGCDTTARIYNVYNQLGNVFGALYLDEGSTDASARSAFDFIRSLMPGDGEVVMKAYQFDGLQTDAGLASYGHTAYVGDLTADFAGMRVGIERVFSKRTLLPAPFNEFTGYDLHSPPTEEAYFRRLHWGAMQMVMEQDCVWDCDPWGSRYATYSPALLSAYRYYSWLHTELVPYLHSYDYQMYETGQPVFRGSDATNYTTRLGNELFVAYVTEPGVNTMAITLPAGEWINYWNEAEVYDGPSTIYYPVPLGREPIFIRKGALIPMRVGREYTGHGTSRSQGSLTVLVYPSDSSSFLYRDEGYWVTFGSNLDGIALTLSASPAPSQPVLYRIGRWTSEPFSVGVNGTTVTVNQGDNVARVASEYAVNGASSNAWFYDGPAERLIVKVFLSSAGKLKQTTTSEPRPNSTPVPRVP